MRCLRLAVAVAAALGLASCATVPSEPKAPKIRSTVSAAVSASPRPRTVEPSKPFTAVTPAVYTIPASQSSFPKLACKGPRVAEGQVEGGKIVKGWNAQVGDWPGFVSIRVRTETEPDKAIYFCGGSAIDGRWVLTAAHCVHGEIDGQDARGLFQEMAKRYPDYTIVGKGYLEVVGGADRLSAPSQPRGVRVKRVVVYPGYGDEIKGKDIALLELEEPLPGPFARVSLSPATDPPDVMPIRAMVAGFGRTVAAGQPFKQFSTARGGTAYAMSEVLLETTVPTARRDQCGLGDAKICAAEERYGGPDTCSGDSGGPLVVFDRDKCPYVIGLTSYGDKQCGRKDTFGVYTRISTYAAWIRQYVPGVATTQVPFDRDRLEQTYRGVWASVARIEALSGSLPVARRIAVGLCQSSGPACVPRTDGPLADGESFLVGASAQAGHLIIFATSAQGVVRQLYATAGGAGISGPITAEATARWHFDQGRIIALSIPSGAMELPQVTRATDNDGAVNDPVAYMAEIESASRHPSSAVGVMELSVRQ